jgi:cell division septum initiation protein DivIVA
MPDESRAADEHAILQEITAPLATLPDDALPSVSDVEFPVVLRGYDRLAVDAYVKRTSQLVAELQATRSPEAAVRRGLERVGEEVAGILQRAHEAASEITAQSRSDAEDRLEKARAEAAQITAGSERRLKELDAETDRIWAERQRIVEDAQSLARQLLELAQSAAARFPAADDPEASRDTPERPPLVEDPDTTQESPDRFPVYGETETTEDSGHRGGGDSFPSGPSVPPPIAAHPPEAEAGEGEEPDLDATTVMPPLRPEGDRDH